MPRPIPVLAACALLFATAWAHAGTPVARVQIAPEEMPRLPEVEQDLTTGLLAVGYAGVEIDPAGYRSPA